MSLFRLALSTFGNYTLASYAKTNQVTEEAWNGTDVTNELAKVYSDNLRKGVSGVMQAGSVGDDNFERQQRLEANVARFATYKANRVAKALQALKTDKNGNARSREEYNEKAGALMKTSNRYQVAEHNTTVGRTRTAKQWAEFNQESHKRLFPNLRWLPSRSAEPRPEHVRFYGIVLPKDHPFWRTNIPGDLWNCKCDLEETSEPVTSEPEKLTPATPDLGLEGNPGITGKVFSDKASYFNVPEATARKCDSAYRRLTLDNARKNLQGKTVTKEVSGKMIDIGFNKKGLSHIQHDWFPEKWIKDMMLEKMDQFMEKATYMNSDADNKGNPQIRAYHYYGINILGDLWILNVREMVNGQCFLYSLTQKKET